mmetsp:Transcript_14481/g.41058  ORF Transcript_14481/g.41058 Transcript_14481/m.41058 type:complete len:164 (+) Transcript_14481:357-848(+)
MANSFDTARRAEPHPDTDEPEPALNARHSLLRSVSLPDINERALPRSPTHGKRLTQEVWYMLRETYVPPGAASRGSKLREVGDVLELREHIKARIPLELPANVSTTLQVCDSYTCGLAAQEYISKYSSSMPPPRRAPSSPPSGHLARSRPTKGQVNSSRAHSL